MERFRLDGQVAVVTGGSRGIGRASALALAEPGAQVVVSSRKLEACQEVVGEIEAQGGQGLAVAAHSGKLNDIQRLMDQAREHYGRIDILLNNAGMRLRPNGKSWPGKSSISTPSARASPA